ncbi:MAG: hypothetical protein AB1440_01470 [Pseudomonadota bacterium]
MDEKPFAGLVTAIIIAPLAVLCCLGPLLIGSALGGVAGWLGGQRLGLTAVLALSAGAIGYAVMRRRRAIDRNASGHPLPDGRAPEDKCRCP